MVNQIAMFIMFRTKLMIEMFNSYTTVPSVKVYYFYF